MMSHTLRAGRVVLGLCLLLLGIVLSLPLVPGPGILLVAVGLALLSTEFEWARRLRNRVRAELARLTGRRDVG